MTHVTQSPELLPIELSIVLAIVGNTQHSLNMYIEESSMTFEIRRIWEFSRSSLVPFNQFGNFKQC